MPAENGCAHVREQLPWYVNGTLEGPEAAAVTAHLDVCPDCSADLRALSAFSAGIDRHGVPGRNGEAGSRSADARRFHIAAALAAGLAVPALLGIYWGTLGFPTGVDRAGGDGQGTPVVQPVPPIVEHPPEPIASLQIAVALDLTAGGSRGPGDLPTLLLPAGATAVTIGFRPPPGATGTRLELRDSSGAALARLDAAPASDRSGRATCIAPASLLSREGEYSLVLIGPGPGGAAEYAYPFRVGRP